VHLEAINHNSAIDLMLGLMNNMTGFYAYFLAWTLNWFYKRMRVHRTVLVRISGSAHVPPEPSLIDQLMEDYFLLYEMQKHVLHPKILAAEIHDRLVSIHPFIDGKSKYQTP
jgi:hypothetical protein